MTYEYQIVLQTFSVILRYALYWHNSNPTGVNGVLTIDYSGSRTRPSLRAIETASLFYYPCVESAKCFLRVKMFSARVLSKHAEMFCSVFTLAFL